MKAGSVYGQVLSTVSVACALVVTALVVRRQLASPSAGERQSGPPTPVSGWIKLVAGGHRMGPAGAPVTILEFADFECPFCRAFTEGALRAIRAEYPTTVAVIFREWPLPYHQYARQAAQAAECAADQGRFESFHAALYAKQDSLGLKSFTQFAAEAGVPDTIAFAQCATSTMPVPAIDSDIAAARRAGGAGTPTIIINGLLIHDLPDSAGLDSLVRQAIAKVAGRRP